MVHPAKNSTDLAQEATPSNPPLALVPLSDSEPALEDIWEEISPLLDLEAILVPPKSVKDPR